MSTIELERHIGNQITDVAQSLEELKTLYESLAFIGLTRLADIDGKIVSIEEMISRVDKFAQMAREIEKNFKYV